LQLAPRPPKTARTLHRLVVELTNDDRLAGDLVALDDTTLTLDTWYAGRLVLQRSMVRRIECRLAMPDAIYAGPTDAHDWKSVDNPQAWVFKQGKLYSVPGMYGTLGKDVGLPDRAAIDFELAWRGQPFWNVGLYYADARNMHGAGGYMISCNGDNINLNRVSANTSRSFEGGERLTEFRKRNRIHVSLRCDKAKKLIALFFDGKLVKQWMDPGEFAGQGTAMMFNSQGQSQIRIATIIVTDWDGRLDTGTTSNINSNEDLVELTNKDKVSGVVRGIAKGEVALTTSYADVKVPIDRVASIIFATQKTGQARRQATDVRAFFADGSRFTVALEALTEQGLAGATENCGKVTLPLDAFTRIQFNVYDKSAADSADDWDATTTSHP